MNKPPLKVKFEISNIVYQLMYIPGLPASADPHYAVAPSTESMRTVNAGVKEVDVPDIGKRFMSWRIEELPSIPGFTVSPRLFLFLKMGMYPADPRRINLKGMVCYAMQPVQPINMDPIQAITDILFDKIREEEVVPQDSGWFGEMFSVPPATPTDEGTTKDDA